MVCLPERVCFACKGIQVIAVMAEHGSSVLFGLYSFMINDVLSAHVITHSYKAFYLAQWYLLH
jgi:hypothetical protein